MQKITSESVQAFNAGERFKKDNTSVIIYSHTGEGSLLLHGNEIAKRTRIDGLQITTAGWNTAVTRERLNGLDGVEVRVKKGVLYLNGKEWDGSLVNPLTFNN